MFLSQWLAVDHMTPDSNSRCTVYLNISFTNSIYSLSAVDMGATVLTALHPLTYRIDPLSLNSLYVYAIAINNEFDKLYGFFIIIGL